MQEDLFSTKKVKRKELDTAWHILLGDYDEYCKRYTITHTGLMTYRDFKHIYYDWNSALFFAEYDSLPVGVFQIRKMRNKEMNLSRIWMLPEWEDKGLISSIIRSFETANEDVKMLSIGTCQMNEQDIEACKNEGWCVTSKMVRMCDELTFVTLEKLKHS